MEQRLNLGGGGTLCAAETGGNIRFEALCPRREDGLYKVWIAGDGGKAMLGTLVPEGERMALRCVRSRRELEQAGLWPVRRGETALAFPFGEREVWHREPAPGRLVADPVLRACLQGSMLYRKTEQGFVLAVPFRTDRPLAQTPLICLARPRRVEGTLCLVWEFDDRGDPLPVHKEKISGHTDADAAEHADDRKEGYHAEFNRKRIDGAVGPAGF